eukprot:6492683-Amphidinium_carterae.4
MSRTFCKWCEQNNLMAVLNKYLEADGTIKQQYVMADNGVEHNHNQAMALHRWHRDNHMVLTNQQMAMRVNAAGKLGQWQKLAMDKPSDNHALFGDNDSGERWKSGAESANDKCALVCQGAVSNVVTQCAQYFVQLAHYILRMATTMLHCHNAEWLKPAQWKNV